MIKGSSEDKAEAGDSTTPFTQESFDELSAFFHQGNTLPVGFRIGQLRRLAEYLEEHEDGLTAAMHADFLTDFGARMEVRHVRTAALKAAASVQGWMREKRVSTGLSVMNLLDRASVVWEPQGVVLIMGTWNAPLAVLLEPLIGALAAGCCAVLKPSELAPQTAAYLAKTLPSILLPSVVKLVCGGPEVASALLNSGFRWNLIFFTGSQRIGQIVYEAAARTMTPVVLELGGKNPTVVTASMAGQLQAVADRIVWGKTLKGGQICIAPDYVLCEESIVNQLRACLTMAVKRMFGEGERSKDLDLIVNEAQWDRLDALVRTAGAQVVYEGRRDRATRYFGPVIIVDPPAESPLMADEIFGPVLPVIKVRSFEDAMARLRGHKSLCSYIFSNEAPQIDAMKRSVSAGSLCINDVAMTYFGTTNTSDYSIHSL
jgi:acyl-CoA reductase-like NAD-dependent aldehyde dehydrogenase